MLIAHSSIANEIKKKRILIFHGIREVGLEDKLVPSNRKEGFQMDETPSHVGGWRHSLLSLL